VDENEAILRKAQEASRLKMDPAKQDAIAKREQDLAKKAQEIERKEQEVARKEQEAMARKEQEELDKIKSQKALEAKAAKPALPDPVLPAKPDKVASAKADKAADKPVEKPGDKLPVKPAIVETAPKEPRPDAPNGVAKEEAPKAAPKKKLKESAWPEERANPFLHVAFEATPATTFNLQKTFKGHAQAISGMALHPRKPILATVSDDMSWKMWSIPTGDLIMSGDGHKDWVSSCDFNPKGTALATGSGDGTVKVGSVDKHGKTPFIEHMPIQKLRTQVRSWWNEGVEDDG
jgi:hypothetical protein